MARPVTMMSVALLTAAAAGILPQFIGVNSSAPPLPNGLVMTTQSPGPAPGPPTTGGPSPGALPVPTPVPPNGSSAPGSGGLSATVNQGPSILVSQTFSGTIGFRTAGDEAVGYVPIRNNSGWPQQVKIELALMEDRNGAQVTNAELKADFKDAFQIEAFGLVHQRLRIVFNNSGTSSGKPLQKASTLLPGSGWLRIRWLPSKSSTCKEPPADPCKEPVDTTSLVPITLSEPPPDNAARMRWVFFASIIAAGLVILIDAAALTKSHISLLDRMGSSTWSFQQSWGANVTLGAGLLGAFLTMFAFPDHPQVMDKNSYIALQVMFATIVGLAPLVYGLIRNDIQANANGVAAVDPQGYVIMFLLAGGLVLCGGIGQLTTTGVLIEEFVLGARLQRSVGVALEIIVALLCALLIVYGLRSLYLTAKYLSAVPTTPTEKASPRIQSGLPIPPNLPQPLPPPMAEWPIL